MDDGRGASVAPGGNALIYQLLRSTLAQCLRAPVAAPTNRFRSRRRGRAAPGVDHFVIISSRPNLAHALPLVPALLLAMHAWGEVVPAAIRACRSMPDEAQRLHCYDSAVDAASEPIPVRSSSTRSESVVRPPGESLAPAVETSAAPPAAITPPPVPAPPIPAPPIPEKGAGAPARQTMFTATVSALSFRQSGAVNVALDYGQVWTQYGPEGRVPLRVGDAVIIRPGLFGASVLVGPTGWITKVHPMENSSSKP